MYNDKKQTNCCLAGGSKEKFLKRQNDSAGAYVDERFVNTHQTILLE